MFTAQETFANTSTLPKVDRGMSYNDADYVSEAATEPMWGEGDPYQIHDMPLIEILEHHRMPQDCSLIAGWLIHTKGLPWTQEARIAKFKSPYRAEIWLEGKRYASLEGWKIFEEELVA